MKTLSQNEVHEDEDEEVGCSKVSKIEGEDSVKTKNDGKI
jgi:hypothetical protein